ncbi:cell division protein SepF [uncultured Cetobacterium sp.]|uniref:cell division protein SepF n=1 Tax=uncultured Cetobacterium sp. TaxID=527638 RepID=UPI0026063030|nr:cell division protein SepF [uncultured Cetobacterium sp.]
MKITKFKNAFKDFTDSVGLTFDPDENSYEEFQEDEGLTSPVPSIRTTSKEEVSAPFINNAVPRAESKTVVNGSQEDCQTIFVNPKSFAECKKIADYIKNDKVVTLNLENVNGKDAQRILDFLSGAINIKEAKWIPISKNVFTSVPKNINFFYDGKNDLRQNTFLDIDHE